MVCAAERAAYRSLVEGRVPPETATYRNPCREWIGAQIRADAWGNADPGHLKRATWNMALTRPRFYSNAASMTRRNWAKGSAPSTRRPLTSKVGRVRMPAAFAAASSALTFSAN